MLNASIAPGSIVVVRDEEWLVTSLDQTRDGQLIQVQGLSELVSGTAAAFYDRLDTIEVQDPAAARLVADDSPRYRRSRLWLEATIRKTPVPLFETRLTVTSGALADALAYQRSAVTSALNPDNLRPRILLTDAVGLGKTLEIGMILGELARRGRADRVLIVCPPPRARTDAARAVGAVRFAVRPARLDRRATRTPRAAGHPKSLHLLQAGDHQHRHPEAGPLRQRPAPAPLGRRGHRRVAQHHQLGHPEQSAGPGLGPEH